MKGRLPTRSANGRNTSEPTRNPAKKIVLSHESDCFDQHTISKSISQLTMVMLRS